MAKPSICWTIAGSDSGGGAGIQADSAAMRSFGVHPCTVISALTAQSSVAVTHVAATPLTMFNAQLQCLLDDLPPKAIKTGMLPSAEQAESLARFYLQNLHDVPLVVDPVAVSASGSTLADDSALRGTLTYLLPIATLVTPNVVELSMLCGFPIENEESLIAGAHQLLQQGAQAVLVKGGHADWQGAQCIDYLISHHLECRFIQPRQPTTHSHGTGCSMASAITAAMANGDPLEDAVVQASAYISYGLATAVGLGQGPGPVNHSQLPTPAEYFPRLEPLHSPSMQGKFVESDTQTLGLYPVVANVQLLARLLEFGVRTVQLRLKNMNPDKVEGAIAEAVLLGRQHNARVYINDHWAFAIKHKAYGIHLGQEDLLEADLNAIQQAGSRLGVSTHGYYELLNALALKPSYIALGHVFATPTKVMKSQPQGLARLSHYVELARGFPTVAIGGINLNNAAEVHACGVGSIAVVRAISQCDDLAQRIEDFTDVIGR
ncbi:MAG: thiamine phosphate synthase [Idiomarina sp.]|nr:thiamine phosphate synthase [Idiomarina sp.]